MTMKKYLDLFEAAPMPTGSAAVSPTAKPIPTSTGVANSATAKPVRPGDASAYVGGSIDATAQVPDTSAAIPGTGSKMVNNPMQDFEEDIEETVEEELAEMMRLSGLQLNEKAPPGAKAERMVKHIKKGYAKDGKLTDKEKSIAFATAWKAKKAGKLDEGVNFVEMMRETEQTLEEMLTELHDEITEYKMTGYMGDKLRDAMELHRYNKNKLMGEANMVHEDDALNELAALAGLSEDGPGQFGMQKKPAPKPLEMTPMQPGVEPVAQFAADLGMPELPGKAFTDKERQDYRKIKAGKKSGVDEDGPGAAVLQGQDKTTAGKMQSGADAVKDFFTKGAEAYKDLYMTGLGMPPDKYTPADPRKPFGPKKSEVKEQGLNECGDMGMEHEDRMNVTTNMSTDGTRDVTINARGSKADDLLQMLKMAGMRPHDDHDHEAMSEPAVVMIGSDEMMEQELEEARKKRTTRYVNTPDEEYQTVASITRQGNDLNREKKQFAGKPRLGDNPMAESALDVDLDAMLESILIREQDSKIEYDEVDRRVKADFPAPKRRDPASQEIPMEPESPESRVTGPRTMKVPGERTGTENYRDDNEKEIYDEGWEDIKTGVSNAVGDFFNTDDSIRRRSGQFRDLETMQQKYKPGTPEYNQLEMRKSKQKERYYGDQGEVVDKAGEPIKVLPPDQWKGGK